MQPRRLKLYHVPTKVCLQADAQQGEWEATKQALTAAIKLIEDLDSDEASSSAIEALFFAILCLQLRAVWHLHHKVRTHSHSDNSPHHSEGRPPIQQRHMIGSICVRVTVGWRSRDSAAVQEPRVRV